MTRPLLRLCFLLGAACLAVAGGPITPARADGPALAASFGIAGRYRPGGWCPVTVTVRSPGPDAVTGQLQVVTAGDPGRSPYGRPGGQPATASVFARTVTLAGGAGPQTFQVETRGVDPGRTDLTVRLAEGAQGDGRVLARVSNQDQNTAPLITGAPVSDGDLFLVGFGGDPGAFLFLNGRSRGAALPPSAGTAFVPGGRSGFGAAGAPPGFGVRGAPPMPSTVQVAEAATAADLPDKAAGYAGVDAFLLRSDAPLDALTGAQTDALKGWVASGGHLIVCGGADPAPLGAAFFQGMLPAAVSGQGALRLTAKPLPGVRVLSVAADGTPLVVSGPCGAGSVTLTAVTPVPASPFWQTLLAGSAGRSSSLLSQVASREETGPSPFYSSGPLATPLLSAAVMRGPSLDAPGTAVIGAFLLVYLLVLVPANYLVLKRLDRKELAWVTIPVLVFVFAAGTFGVGYAAKGGAVFVNRAAVVETTAGRREAGVYAELGIFSPHRSSYDISVTGANALAAAPSPGFGFGFRGGGDTDSYGPATFVQTVGGVFLPDAAVNMWAMRAFDTQSTADLGGSIDAALTASGGSVSNHTSYALTECWLLRGGQWRPLGDLAPGASLPVPPPSALAMLRPNGPLQDFSLPALDGESAAPDSQADVHLRMRSALAAYVRSLGGAQNSPAFYNGMAPSATPAYTPPPGRGLLVGWSRDPALVGPPAHVDGHAVQENDVSLVVVHVP